MQQHIQQALLGSGITIVDIAIGDEAETREGQGFGVWKTLGNSARLPAHFEALVQGTVARQDQDYVHAELSAVLRGEKPELYIEYRTGDEGGAVDWRLDRGRVVHDEQGTPIRFLGTSQPITRLERGEGARCANENARRTLEQQRMAMRSSGVHAWGVDLPNENLASESAESVLAQFAPADFGLRSAAVITLEDRARVAAGVQAYLDGKTERFECEYRIREENGSVRWHLARGAIVHDADGRPIRFTGTSVDVTRLKQVEEADRAANERLELAAQLSGFAIAELDLRGAANADEAMGKAAHWDLGGLWPPLLPSPDRRGAILPEELARIRAAFHDSISGKSPELHVEYRARNADGHGFHWRLARGKCFFDDTGAPVRYIGVSHDIQRLKTAEEEARRAVQQQRLATDLSGVGVWGYELEGGTLTSAKSSFANDGVMASLGYDPDEVAPNIESRLGATVLAEDRSRVYQLALDCVAGKTPRFDAECRFVHKNGSIRWKLVRGIVTRDEMGQPVTFTGTAVDVTQLKQTQEELRRVKDRLELAVLGSKACTWDFDLLDGQIAGSIPVFTNAWELCGYDVPADQEQMGRAFAVVLPPEDVAPFIGQIQTFLDGTAREWEREIRVAHKDGSDRWHLTRGVAERGAEGRATRFIGASIDITDRKQIETELSHARRAAEAANRAKDEFLANVSHEIRTPMNAILGMTELAIDSAASAHQRQLLSTVRSAAKNLLTIINDLLDFSKIEAGKLALDCARFSLRAAVGDTLRALALRAHRKGLELICRVRSEVPDALEGDAGRLRQVLMNLVGNAIKFTPGGEVEVNVEAAPSSNPQTVSLMFSVRDTGIGIALGKQAAIFQAFEQEDSSTTRNYGGTGLGLTISAQLAQMMGGGISIESAPGRGSTFRFSARFARSPHPDAKTVSLEPVADLRVLIVDDNETNRRILEEWLSSWRMQPKAVGGAQAALLALVLAHDAGTPFALVLLDARMPDTDGTTLAGLIRARWGTRAPRLILLSSDDNAGYSPRSRENGILAYLLKPVQQSELLEAIWSVMNLELTRPRKPLEASRPPERWPALRVLVAEDNELNIALLDELSSQRGYAAQFARNGRAALELALQGTCDLMLLDLHMPELDGFEVVRAIRERERETTGHLPVIALTARSSALDRERCLAAGADDFLSKPIDAAALWSTLDRVLAHWPPAGRAAPLGEQGLLDARAILRAFDGQASVLERMRVVFRESVPDQLARIRAALRAEDFARLREAAHQLVGTVGTFSTVAAEVGAALEDAAEREELDGCVALAEQVGSMCDALLVATATLSLDSLVW
jgi:two-component system, sensor histidine kinase and response regulator